MQTITIGTHNTDFFHALAQISEELNTTPAHVILSSVAWFAATREVPNMRIAVDHIHKESIKQTEGEEIHFQYGTIEP